MAYLIPASDSKRLKHIDQQGREELEAHDKVAFRDAATAAATAILQGDRATSEESPEGQDEAGPPPAATPQEVIEKLSAAKGDLDVMLDLINLLEGQHFLGVANVALPSTAQAEQQQQALRLQQEVSQLRDAGSRLRKGALALTAQMQKSQFFFAQLAQLQQHWNLKRSQPGGPGLFQIDVALPLGQHWQLHRKDQQPNTLVDIVQRENGGMELQSSGLPLPDRPLRWLAPLNRPLLRTTPTPDTHQSHATDTVMQDAAPLNKLQGLQTVPVQSELNQGDDHQISLQPQAAEAVAGNAVDGAAAPMQTDAAPQSQSAAPQQASTNNKQTQLADHQHAFAPSELQMIAVPQELQDFVSSTVARCDWQLLGRQEEVLVSLVQQRVGEEVRQVQGAQDMDHPADDLVQRIFAAGSAANPLLLAVQLRLLRLLLLHPNSLRSQVFLAQLQR